MHGGEDRAEPDVAPDGAAQMGLWRWIRGHFSLDPKATVEERHSSGHTTAGGAGTMLDSLGISAVNAAS